MYDYFLGIDPGKKGALVLLASDRIIEQMTVMPSHIHDTLNWLTQHCTGKKVWTMMEKAQAMPKNGVVAMFNYGMGFGELLGALAALKMPYALVPPTTWTKQMHAGMPVDMKTKLRAAGAVKRIYPGIDLRATPKCKVPHDGLVDALLIADFARLVHGKTTSTVF